MPRPTFADPKTDFIFKRIFGSEPHKHLLIELLNTLLELEEGRLITDLSYLAAEQKMPLPEMKLSVVDVKCADQRDVRYVVEMQLFNVQGFEERVIYSVAGPRMPRDPNAAPASANDSASAPPGHPAWEAPATARSRSLEVIPPELNEEPFLEAFEIARMAQLSEAEYEAYEQSKMAEQDARGALGLAREQGEAIGEARGRADGEEQTLRHNVRDVCNALGIGWNDERQAAVDAFSLEELQGLWRSLLRDQRWP